MGTLETNKDIFSQIVRFIMFYWTTSKLVHAMPHFPCVLAAACDSQHSPVWSPPWMYVP